MVYSRGHDDLQPTNDSVERFGALLDPVLGTLGMKLEAGQVSLLARHYELLLQWNRKISLTSVRDPEQVVKRHFGESLFVASVLRAESGTLVDVGSGAGFPGFPLAVARPGIQVTLVESIAKRAAFLKEVARLSANVRVLHGRFEDLDERFDWATVRAVRLERLLLPLSQRAGRLALLMGAEDASRIFKSGLLCWQDPVRLPWGQDRVLLCST